MGKSRKDYEKFLNSISPDRDDEAWIIGGKNRYCGRENYGTMIKLSLIHIQMCIRDRDDGGCFIIEVEDGSDQKNPYRTGRYCAIKKEAAKKILGQEHSIVYMEKSAYSQIIPQK